MPFFLVAASAWIRIDESGNTKLSKLESGLVVVKVFSIIGFIVLALALVGGFVRGAPAIGISILAAEPWFSAGLGGVAGSMLIVVLTFAGFEIIGLAASETSNPARTVPQAIRSLYCRFPMNLL